MLNLKKTALAVLVLSTGVSFAGTMGPVCSAVNVTVPCESTAWHVGGQALYLQPTTTANALNYNVINTADNSFTGRPSNWDWGFQLEAAYHYGTGSDTNLNWYHLNDTNTKTVQGPFSLTDVNYSTSAESTFSVNPKWDEVNLEFGQHIDVADMKSIRFHGGVQYARIDTSASLAVVDPVSLNTSATTNSLTYNGFGPRVGLDFDYNWGNGLGVYAKGATSLLAGTSKFAFSDVALGGLSGSATTVVPELESKLGIKYDYAMAQGDLTLDFGWLWINYFNAQSNLQISLPLGSVSNGDFGLQGLYFGLKWMGNVV